MVILVAGRGSNISQLPLEIFLELLETLESNLEDILVGELGRVVRDLHAQERDDRHDGCDMGGFENVLETTIK